MTNCIETKGLVKEYKTFTLGPIDLKVPGGSIMGLIGENGAGKTTLIKSMLGIVKPTAGETVLLGGVETVLCRVFKTWDKGLYRDCLDKFGLSGAKNIKELSRGMRMKLSLAAALAHRPRLLLLDEATAGLDPVVRDEILDEFLAFVSDEDHAILISSHITSDLEKVADYIAYLHQGKLLLCDEKDRLLESYGRLVCAREELAQVDRGYVVATRKSQYSTEALIRHKNDFKRTYPRLTVEPVTLDELMVFVVKGEKA